MEKFKIRDGSPRPSLKTLAEKLDANLWKRLDDQTRFLLSVYLRWEHTARASCGTPFIHQAYVNPSLPGPKSNSHTDTSLRRM
jgi:hypothetical protein